MQIQPYLFFDGRCEEATDFYVRALGAKLGMKMRFSDSPETHQPGMVPPGSENKIMHMSFTVGSSEILASDGRCQGKAKFDGCALSLTVSSVAEAEKTFTALSEGGQVQMPLTKTFFSPMFGMVADQFGVSWMVYVAH